ncbi:hypothetical protein ACZ91_17950 [Streptomyces regensis]|nr:hypothetical protein ACZ91_17950 [Streptomyces regensis]
MELPTDKDLKDAPNAKVTADFTLKNGELSQVDVDLRALRPCLLPSATGLSGQERPAGRFSHRQ